MFETEDAFLNDHPRFSLALAPCLLVLILLLVVALMTTLCGGVAQAQVVAARSDWDRDDLHLSGNLPVGTVNESYNAVLAVDGGKSPYHFSVRRGELPPGITLNPTTGTLSGKPLTSGAFSFGVLVTDSWRHAHGTQPFSFIVRSGVETVDVNVSPTSTSLSSNQKQQFTATVSGTSNTGATWSATSGTVNGNGLYTAPAVSAKTNVVVTATSVADSSKFASAAITIEPATSQALQITTGNLPLGQQGDSYSEVFSATGGTTPYRWSISAGTPPAGFAMNANGDFAGMPTAAGTFSFTVTATDATNKTATGNFSVTVVAGGNFDGPAELPRVTVPTAMADTPAPDSTISVAAGGNLQAALNSANCGDTISLQAGETFTGLFTLPAKNCDINHWIIIRTSTPDTSLPPEGSRLTPCYAGIASLPGRPSFNCSVVKNVLAKVTFAGVGSGPFLLAAGANYYRLLGLEITRTAGTGAVGTLIFTKATADHIIVDRSWLHGTAQDETSNGVALTGMTNAAVINSFMTDFHCTSIVGDCTDSHTIDGGLGSLPGGPYSIVGNFLEAAGEGILLGGGPATTVPADIVIQGNHFFKPLIWQQGRPGFVGGKEGYPFVVKNLFEMKNGQRVLFEGNILEYSWGGFSQFGDAIILGVRSQADAKTKSSVCPLCQVTDVTIRYSTISHVGTGIDMDTPLSAYGGAALAGARYSIHDITVDDINAKEFSGQGALFLIMNGWKRNVLNNVMINHVTGFSDATSQAVFYFYNLTTNPQMWGFVTTNSILGSSGYTIASAGGGPTDCAHSDVPLTALDVCFASYSFNNNAIIGSSLASKPSAWPTGNHFPASVAAIQFTNFSSANGGNYQLLPSSPYVNAGSDGKDLGADISALQAAIAGVY